MSCSSSRFKYISSRLLTCSRSRALGMFRQELACPLDLVGERDRRQALGSNQVVDELALDGRSALGQVVFERARQRERLGAARRFGILA